MRLLIVNAYFYPHVGGGEQALLDIATEFVKKGIKVILEYVLTLMIVI